MNDSYFIVNKELLPEYIDKVVYATKLLTDGSAKTISDAVKIAGISRSTYYKYKDKVYGYSFDSAHKCIFSLSLSHEKGILSNVINTIAEYSGNILTIHQNIPIHNIAHLTISLDITYMTDDISVLLKAISNLKGASNIRLIAID
ncbi:MAG: ACT domain-containing protein [Eubacteriaceae bacterium]